jgi:MFS transporter, DHA3 family, multidrug efflux protein
MTDGLGANWIGAWFGTGPERGLALMFTLAGLIGVVVTVAARASRSYARLSAELAEPAEVSDSAVPSADPVPAGCPDVAGCSAAA